MTIGAALSCCGGHTYHLDGCFFGRLIAAARRELNAVAQPGHCAGCGAKLDEAVALPSVLEIPQEETK